MYTIENQQYLFVVRWLLVANGHDNPSLNPE